jgi:uncharacterized membrane protein YqjE
VDPVVCVKEEDAEEGHEEKEDDSHLHVLFLVVMLLNVLHILTVMLWVKVWIFAETLSRAVDSIVTDTVLTTDLKVGWVSGTWKTLRSEEPN